VVKSRYWLRYYQQVSTGYHYLKCYARQSAAIAVALYAKIRRQRDDFIEPIVGSTLSVSEELP